MTAAARPRWVMTTGSCEAAARLITPAASERSSEMGTIVGKELIGGTSFGTANSTTSVPSWRVDQPWLTHRA